MQVSGTDMFEGLIVTAGFTGKAAAGRSNSYINSVP